MDYQKQKLFEATRQEREEFLKVPRSDPMLAIRLTKMLENDGRLADYAKNVHRLYHEKKLTCTQIPHLTSTYLDEKEVLSYEDKIEIYRNLGCDLATYGLQVRPWMEVGHRQEMFAELIQEYEVSKKSKVRKPCDYFIRKWIQLRLNAIKRGKSFASDLNPIYLALITTSACPITGEFYAMGESDDPDESLKHLSFDRSNNELGYVKHNIMAMSVLANQAKSNLSFPEVLARAAGVISDSALNRAQWTRMALSMAGSCTFTDQAAEHTPMRLGYFGAEGAVSISQMVDYEHHAIYEKLSKWHGPFTVSAEISNLPLAFFKKARLKEMTKVLKVHELRAEMMIEEGAKETKAMAREMKEHGVLHANLDRFFSEKFSWMTEMAEKDQTYVQVLNERVSKITAEQA